MKAANSEFEGNIVNGKGRQVLVLTYKALNGLGPGSLKDRFLPYDPTQHLRTSQGALLKEPSLKEVRGTACRERAFLAAAPRLWNALPSEIRLVPMLMTFRRLLLF